MSTRSTPRLPYLSNISFPGKFVCEKQQNDAFNVETAMDEPGRNGLQTQPRNLDVNFATFAP